MLGKGSNKIHNCMHVEIEEIALNVVHKYIKVIDDQYFKHAQSWRESLLLTRKLYNPQLFGQWAC